jgi:hypothetical protein
MKLVLPVLAAAIAAILACGGSTPGPSQPQNARASGAAAMTETTAGSPWASSAGTRPGIRTPKQPAAPPPRPEPIPSEPIEQSQR